MTREALLAPLARFAAEWLPPVPGHDPALDERLESIMIDFAGSLISGHASPAADTYVTALRALPGESGPARVAGRAATQTVDVAAMLNAAFAHVTEVDDVHRGSTSHPGIVVIPTIMALSGSLGVTEANELRAAVVAGYEAMTRVGAFLGAAHFSINHTTATAGSFGAAAAAGRLMRLDAKQMLDAFGHAGTQAAGLWQFQNDGAALAKLFHAGMAARAGITAARLAGAGIPGATHVLDGPRGMLAAWNLAAGDPAQLVPDGHLMVHEMTIKSWPTCGQMHTALDCARALTQRDGWPGAAAIADVRVDVPTAAQTIAGQRTPKSLVQLKFSTSYCVAATLNGRPPDFRGCTPALLTDDAIASLEEHVTVETSPEFDRRFPKERPARVTVTLKDGRTFSEERAFRGGDPEAPWGRQALAVRLTDILALASETCVDPAKIIIWATDFATQTVDWNSNGLFDLIPIRDPA